ncbi:MAG: hypothetical protein JWN30_337 [Bacilli bacterium]|nr:hypothetical protein [Bacilli bacterium]
MDWLSLTVLGLIALVIVTTFILYRGGVLRDIPFFNWFELHYTVSVLGILAIILLAQMGKLESNTITTLFSSLIAYVLGASTGKTRPSASGEQISGGSSSAVEPAAAIGTDASASTGAAVGAGRSTGSSHTSPNSSNIPV